MALKLVDRGYQSVFVLEGGWEAWKAAGHPVEPK
ncbi:MAG TPA: rhodanese-like domain-containing protein [Desulfobacterales bacterium]